MRIVILFYCILALECFARVHTQELYNMRRCVDYDNEITSKLREESLELSLHEAEFQMKTLQEKELERILHEEELQKTLQEKESKIQRLETEMTSLKANYTDDFLQSVCSVHPSAVFAHPVICQLYYNCSHRHDYFWNLEAEVPYRSFYLSECDYPFVFSTENLECQNYTAKECDKRILHKWELENLAFGKAISFSSTGLYSTTYPECVVGGLLCSNYDYTIHTDFELYPWLTIALGHISVVNNIVIYNRIDGHGQWLHSVEIRVGMSSVWSEMKVCGTFDGPSQTGQNHIIKCETEPALYGSYVTVKIVRPNYITDDVNASGGKNCLVLRKIEIYGYYA